MRTRIVRVDPSPRLSPSLLFDSNGRDASTTPPLNMSPLFSDQATAAIVATPPLNTRRYSVMSLLPVDDRADNPLEAK